MKVNLITLAKPNFSKTKNLQNNSQKGVENPQIQFMPNIPKSNFNISFGNAYKNLQADLIALSLSDNSEDLKLIPTMVQDALGDNPTLKEVSDLLTKDTNIINNLANSNCRNAVDILVQVLHSFNETTQKALEEDIKFNGFDEKKIGSPLLEKVDEVSPTGSYINYDRYYYLPKHIVEYVKSVEDTEKAQKFKARFPHSYAKSHDNFIINCSWDENRLKLGRQHEDINSMIDGVIDALLLPESKIIARKFKILLGDYKYKSKRVHLLRLLDKSFAKYTLE